MGSGRLRRIHPSRLAEGGEHLRMTECYAGTFGSGTTFGPETSGRFTR